MLLFARILIAFCAVLVITTSASATSAINIVASFSILGDMVNNVGGDRVKVTTLVGPDSDAHAYEPTPAAAKAVRGASLVVVNGLGFEGWMDRLITASGYRGMVVVASTGIKPREMEDDHGHDHGKAGDHDKHEAIDPHAWQNLENGRLYVNTITAALIAIDPEGALYYTERAAAYNKQLADLETWAKAEFSAIPKEKRRMITSHDAFGYLGDTFDIEILSPMGLGTGKEPTASGVKKLIQQIKKEKITAVFVENIANPRMIQQIAKESGVKVGGALYSDALSAPTGPAASYTEMFKNNVTKIVTTMKQGL
jgi:zinc/manganese transport system substrate-binding protein